MTETAQSEHTGSMTGADVRALRARLDYSQTEFAILMGWNRTTLSDIECGKLRVAKEDADRMNLLPPKAATLAEV